MKIMLVIDGNKSDSHQDFKESMMSLAQDVSQLAGIEQVKIVLTDISPPKTSIIPFNQSKIAVLSVYQSSAKASPSFLRVANLRGAYLVDEAIPVAYEKNWIDGECTPGVNLLTLFRQKPGISYDQFIDYWHNGHTPLSLKIHPLWNYNRNVVTSNMIDESPWYDGIVEEQVNDKSHLLNPFKFFGSPLSILPNMISVYFDVKKFIDYSSIETYLANEYWVKS